MKLALRTPSCFLAVALAAVCQPAMQMFEAADVHVSSSTRNDFAFLIMELAERVVEVIRKVQYEASKSMAKAALEETVPGWKDLLETQDRVMSEDIPGAAIVQNTRLVRD